MKTKKLLSGRAWRGLALLGAGWLVFGTTRALAVTLSVSSATAAPGDVVQICVDMAGEGFDVAGVQTDLVWAPECAEIDQSSCQAGPHGKQLHKSLRSSGRLKVLVLSLDNVDPIPDGSRLYCCSFRVRGDAAMTNCPVTLQNVGASDPQGNAITTNPLAGTIRLSGTGAGQPAPAAPVGRPAAPAPGAAVGGAGSQVPQAEAGAPAAGGVAAAPAVRGGVAPVIIATPGGEVVAAEQPPSSAEAGAAAEAAPPAAAQPPLAAESAAKPAPAGQPVSAADATPAAATPEAAVPVGTTPALVGTPTSKPVATATRQPVRVATPTEKVDESACQISRRDTGRGTVMLGLGVGLLVALRIRKRAR